MQIRKTTVFVVVALVVIVGGALGVYVAGVGTPSTTASITTGSSSTTISSTSSSSSSTTISSSTSSSSSSTTYPPYTNLPAGCTKPANGFLVIANINGFNDSIQHGAPIQHWPIIRVKQGTTVNITVCNSDRQAHGFQVSHYFDSNVETVDPGQVVHISFVADKVGSFEIYCSIFCSIHIYMQNGLLQVTS